MSGAWPEVSLRDVCELKYGKSLPNQRRSGSGCPVYGSNGEVGRHRESLTDGSAIIIGRKGSFGEVAYSVDPCWPIDTTYFIDRTATEANLRWLYYRLRKLPLKELNRAAAIPGLNREDAYALRMRLPPVEEQRRIAGLLDAASALQVKRRGSLAGLDTLTRAIFFDMFGDSDSAASGWPVAELAGVVEDGTTVTYGIVQAGDEFHGGVPYIRTGDIVDGEIKAEGLRHTDPSIAARFPRSRVRTGEVVMSIRATVGTSALVPAALDGANLTQGTARIAPGPRVLALYLLHYLRSEPTQRWIERQVKGATFREITLTRLRELPVLVPPLALQCEFVARLECVGRMSAHLRSSEALLENLFASLQQRAFRGEL